MRMRCSWRSVALPFLSFAYTSHEQQRDIRKNNGLTQQEPNGVLMGKNLIGGVHVSHGGGQNNEIVMP